MKPNQKMYTKDGKYQVCLFPMDYMYITQTSSPTSFSHCCGHPCDYIGTTEKYPIYAPCDMVLTYKDNTGNTRGWTSQKEVATPNGIKRITVSFTHDDNPPFSTLGDKISQGDLIGHTGTSGFVTGDHTHIDQSLIPNAMLVDYGIACSSGNECYALSESTYPYNVFYSNDTEIVETEGYTFIEYNGGTPTPTETTKSKMIYYLKRRE